MAGFSAADHQFMDLTRNCLFDLFTRNDFRPVAKEKLYQDSRREYTTLYGWPPKFDRPYHQNEQMWQNRVRWVTANLTREGIIHKTSGESLISLTQKGVNLLESGDRSTAFAQVVHEIPVLAESGLSLDKLYKNTVFYGPSGTGKTWSVTNRVIPEFGGQDGGRVEIVTFHPNFQYEEFIEGLRPLVDASGSGATRFAVVPGVFRRICSKAAADPDAPYLLVIDEINRANLASVLGELIIFDRS